jgi:hypothetical protein
VSADTIVPGAAEGAGGGLATIGYSDQTRLTPLTVGFHEPQFLEVLNAENQELLDFGPPALWDSRTRQEHNVPMGPANPQGLNRYAYCLNNPVRHIDPTGHFVRRQRLSPDAWGRYEVSITRHRNELDKKAHRMGVGFVIGGVAVFAIIGGAVGLTVGPGPTKPYVAAGAAVLTGAASGILGGKLMYEGGYAFGGGTRVEQLNGFMDFVDEAEVWLPTKEGYDGTYTLACAQLENGYWVFWIEYGPDQRVFVGPNGSYCVVDATTADDLFSILDYGAEFVAQAGTTHRTGVAYQ